MAKIYSLNPALNLRQSISEDIYNSSEKFVDFLKAYYEWMHTTEITYQIISGTFQKNELIVGQTSKNYARINYIKSSTELVVVIERENFPFENFELIVGQTSGATARLLRITDNVLRQAQQILPNRDVDKSIDIFSEYLKDELYSAIPANFAGDKRELAKRIRDYYQSKGHEQSYRFFMKLLYDQDIEIAYPGDEVLRVSDGNFQRETVIRARIIDNPESPIIFNFLFKTIKGRISGSIAKVVDIKKIFVGSVYLAEMKLSLASGVFIADEPIYDLTDTNPIPLETTVYGIVSSYEIVYGGSGYAPGDVLTVTGDGEQATLRVSDTYRSGIDAITLVSTGYGYQKYAVTFADNTGTGGSNLTVMVSEIANTYDIVDGANTYTVGDVVSVKVINKGQDYFDVPTITLRDDTIYALGMISEKNINIIDAGQNYKPGETIELNLLVEGETGYTTRAVAEVASVAEPPDPPSTNYILFSDEFDQWSLANVDSFSANSEIDTTQTVDPFGTNTAEYLEEPVTGLVQLHYIEKQVEIDTPGYYTFSVYLKDASSIDNLNSVIHFSNNADANTGDIVAATVLLSGSNTIASTSFGANSEVTNTSIEFLSNDWRRVSISGKCDDTSTTLYLRVFFHDSIDLSYIGEEYESSGLKGLFVASSQFEPGNVATTYIQSSDTVGVRLGGDYNIYLEDGDGTYNKLMLESDDFAKYDTTNTISSVWVGNGPIERIKMLNRGRGYQLQYVNDITLDFVDTLSGYGANLEVTGIMGSGANVIVDTANNSSGIGAIKKIEPVNFGVDYTTATVSVIDSGNGDANIVPIITGSGTTVGQFIGDSGKVDYKKIQDSYFYQQYSYVIKSGIEISKYRDVLKKMIHPSGLEVFGEIAIRNNLNLRMRSDDPLRINDILKIFFTFLSEPNSGTLRSWSLTNNDKSADDLQIYKVSDFIGGGDTVFAEVTIGQVHFSSTPSPTIQTYKYYNFATPYGEAVYFEIERQVKIEGTVSVNVSTKIVTGSGTNFFEFFSAGDEFAVIDRLGPTGSNRFQITEVISSTQMRIAAAPAQNISGAEAYKLSI
jgi:hypothetical protein